MSVGLAERTVANEPPKYPDLPKYAVAKIGTHVVRGAKIVCSITGEDLQDYLTRVLEPIVERDRVKAFEDEEAAREGIKPKRKKNRKPPAE